MSGECPKCGNPICICDGIEGHDDIDFNVHILITKSRLDKFKKLESQIAEKNKVIDSARELLLEASNDSCFSIWKRCSVQNLKKWLEQNTKEG